MAGDGSSKVMVAVRIRPRLEKMGERFEPEVFQKIDDGTLAVNTQVLADSEDTSLKNQSKSSISFSFDSVFDKDATQEEVYTTAAADLVDAVLQGYNATIFTYGQTGSGKTHTVLGGANDDGTLSAQSGLFLRSLYDLFSYKTQNTGHIEMHIRVSIVEIYNENIRDLLAHENSEPVVLRDAGEEVFLQNVTDVEIMNVVEANELYKIGMSNRVTFATKMNDVSSRSHAVFMLDIEQVDLHNPSNILTSRLSLVDLAGSERIKKSKAEGERLVEAQNINKSLSALGNVVNALYKDQSHVPYRNSKLTRLLKNSFQGMCKVLLIANLSPICLSASESLSTLRFADRVKQMKAKDVDPTDILAETEYLTILKRTDELKAELRIARECAEYPLQLEGVAPFGDQFEQHVLQSIEKVRQWKKTKDEERVSERDRKIEMFIKAMIEEEKKNWRENLEVAEKERNKWKSELESFEANLKDVTTDFQSKIQNLESKKRDLDSVVRQHEVDMRQIDERVGRYRERKAMLSQQIMANEKDFSTLFAREEQEWAVLERTWVEQEENRTISDQVWNVVEIILQKRKKIQDYQKDLRAIQAQVGDVQREKDTFDAVCLCREIVYEQVLGSIGIEAPQGYNDRVKINFAAPSAPSPVRAQHNLRDNLPRAARDKPATGRYLFDDENIVKQVVMYLQQGTSLLKHGRTGKPHHRFFFVSEDRKSMCWCELKGGKTFKKSNEVSRIMLADVDEFILGQYTKVFQKQSQVDPKEFYVSFSLVYSNGSRTLDVVCENETEFEAWIVGLSALIAVKPFWGQPLDITQFKEYQTLDMDEQKLCADWHVVPMSYLEVKRHIEEMNKTEQRVVSIGELRSLAKTDILRSQKIYELLAAKGILMSDGLKAWGLYTL